MISACRAMGVNFIKKINLRNVVSRLSGGCHKTEVNLDTRCEVYAGDAIANDTVKVISVSRFC